MEVFVLGEREAVKWMRWFPREKGGVGVENPTVVSGLSVHALSRRCLSVA